MLGLLARIGGYRLWPQKICLVVLQTGPRRLESDLGPVNIGSKELSWPTWADSPYSGPSSLVFQVQMPTRQFPLSSPWIIAGIWEGSLHFLVVIGFMNNQFALESPYSFRLAYHVIVHVEITKWAFISEVRQGLLLGSQELVPGSYFFTLIIALTGEVHLVIGMEENNSCEFLICCFVPPLLCQKEGI